MRISDWSSDVCSSDLLGHALANRLDERHAILEPLAYRGHDNEPVEDCHTCKADEADRRGHREVDPGEREGEYPASKAERHRSEEHTSELQSLMRISYAVFCLKKKTTQNNINIHTPNE